MITPAPKIDQRTATTIAQQLQQLLADYLPDQFGTSDVMAHPGVHAALVAAFSHHAGRIIERLNQVPDKNLLAFLNLLGASQLPPQPARVPLTFFLSEGSTVDTLVPAGTTIAATGDGNVVTFETEKDFVVTATRLVSVAARDPGRDRYSNYSAIAQTRDDIGVAAFAGNQAIAHMLLIQDAKLFSYPSIQTLELSVRLKQPIANPDPRQIQWDLWNGQTTLPLTCQDATANLTTNNPPQSTPVPPPDLTFSLSAAGLQALQESPAAWWLRGRLLTSITRDPTPQVGAVRANSQDPPVYQLPEVQLLRLWATVGRSPLPIDAAFSNQFPVNLQQPFFPFGEKPRFGDTCYFACREGFAFASSTVTLTIDVANPITMGMNSDDIKNINPTLQWEFWTGKVWRSLGTSTKNGSTPSRNQFVDETLAFTKSGENIIRFTLPEQSATFTLNGITNFWIRVRIIAGDYGKEAQYIEHTSTNQEDPPTFSFQRATFAPPVINIVTVNYSLTTPMVNPKIFAINDFRREDGTQRVASFQPFSPFQPTQDIAPSLYLGFQPPAGQAFPNQPINLYFEIADVLYGNSPTGSMTAAAVSWEYWNGDRWAAFNVQDDTHGLRHSGLVELLVPADFAPRLEFGVQQYWLRIVWHGADHQADNDEMPKLQQIVLNTAIAAQITTIPVEILGSSNGTSQQRFRTTRTPVLSGQSLEVRELTSAESGDRLTELATLTVNSQAQQTWVEWQEVPDFYGSTASDRHYTLNHLTGEVCFGDGLNGRIPPAGTNNVRIRYRTGGGAAGNRAAGDVAELKTTIPFIDSVRNLLPAAGGANAETLDALKQRLPRQVRHGGQAVTLEDYEDLAMLASPGVARAKCLSIHNLAAANPATVQRGYVSVIIVPQTGDPKPMPTLELVERVQSYLEQNAIATANIVVVGPAYVQINVSAEVALTDLNQRRMVDQSIQQSLRRFLHPLTGGFDGTGWGFGQTLHRSDLYALLETIPGVDHIHSLTITETKEFPNTQQRDRTLIYSGNHTLTYI
ncbi:MAG: putative baseplate assembly protein [Leptolyngbyaceae cyanobacterium bins.302]|nr:putative baseplate assembly protein [Leptolyngbyaceae cyanobacterium bins.302]